MKKAERIYRETKYQTRKHIDTWGYDPKVSMGCGWYTRTYKNPDGELIYTRTQNALLKMLSSDKKHLETLRELNIIDEEEYTIRKQVFDMMERSSKNITIF